MFRHVPQLFAIFPSPLAEGGSTLAPKEGVWTSSATLWFNPLSWRANAKVLCANAVINNPHQHEHAPRFSMCEYGTIRMS